MSEKNNKRDRDLQQEIAVFADFLEPILEEAADELEENFEDIQEWMMMALMAKKLNPNITARELLPNSLADFLEESISHLSDENLHLSPN